MKVVGFPLLNIANTEHKVEYYNDYVSLLKNEGNTIEEIIPILKEQRETIKFDDTIKTKLLKSEESIKIIDLEKRLADIKIEIFAKLDYASKYEAKLKRDAEELKQLKSDTNRFLGSYLKDAKKILSGNKHSNTKILRNIVAKFEEILATPSKFKNVDEQKALGFRMLKSELDNIKYKT